MRSPWNLINLLVLLLILFPQASLGIAAYFSGTITEVISGDTLIVVNNGRIQRIRLFGVDAPDGGEPFGPDAKKFTAGIVLGKQVTVQLYGKDQDKQLLAEVFLAEGRALGEGLVGEGFARWYRTHTRDAGLGQRKQESTAAALDLAISGGRRAGDQEIVMQSVGWWHWKHVRDRRLKDLEAQARAEGRGLWSARNLLPLSDDRA